MHFTALLRIGLITGATCGIALYAGEVWNTKDSTQWTDEEIDKILTDSPWAKRAKVTFSMHDQQDQRRSGRGYPGSGGGYPGGASGGYPGGGGGGYPGGGGIGFPGGGIGFPGGGGRGGGMGRGGGQRGPGSLPPMDVTMRWETAQPIQDALSRREDRAQTETAKPPAGSSQSDSYIITVFGLRMPSRNGLDASDENDPQQDRQDAERMRDRLLDSTRLIVKGRSSIIPADVKVNTNYGRSEIRFIFPRANPISLDDKEVTFESQLGPVKVEQKFHIKDMVYKGKLAM